MSMYINNYGAIWTVCIIMYKYTVNGLRLQANVASAVLTQIELECTCSVPILNEFCWSEQRKKPRNKQRHSMKFKRPCLQHWPNNTLNT